MLSPELGAYFVRVKCVGVINRSQSRPRLAERRAFRNIGDRVWQGRDTASEPNPDVGAASVHRLKHGDRLAFLHPLADKRRALGADIAQIGAALGWNRCPHRFIPCAVGANLGRCWCR